MEGPLLAAFGGPRQFQRATMSELMPSTLRASLELTLLAVQGWHVNQGGLEAASSFTCPSLQQTK